MALQHVLRAARSLTSVPNVRGSVCVVRRFSGVVGVKNPHLEKLDADYLYHLGISSGDDLQELFGDVQFLCVGGSADRIESLAERALSVLGPTGHNLVDIPRYIQKLTPIGKIERFSMYKLGPLLMCSHGMGMPSCSIMLHEVTKMLNYAGAKDVEYFRLGTSGGVGVEPGTVVVTTEGVNGLLKAEHVLPVLGRNVTRPTVFDSELVKTITELEPKRFPVVPGKTMACDCFYEGQGRLDGAICEYEEQDKFEFLQKAYDMGVRNIEMEAVQYGAFTQLLGIRAADVCVALLDRMQGDQVSLSPKTLSDFGERPATLVLQHITQVLQEQQEQRR